MASFSQMSDSNMSAPSAVEDQNLPFGSPSQKRKSYKAYNGEREEEGEEGEDRMTRDETKRAISQLAGFSSRLEAVLLALLREQDQLRSEMRTALGETNKELGELGRELELEKGSRERSQMEMKEMIRAGEDRTAQAIQDARREQVGSCRWGLCFVLRCCLPGREACGAAGLCRLSC